MGCTEIPMMRAFDDLLVGGPHGLRIVQAEPHSVDIALVRDVRGVDFQRNRIAELLRDQHRFVRRVRNDSLRDGDAERGEQRLRLHLGQHGAALRQGRLADQARRLEIRGRSLASRSRHLQERPLISIEGGDVRKRLDRRLGRAEDGDAARSELLPCRSDLLLAHPAREDRFRGAARRFDHRSCSIDRFGHRLRRQDRQQAVHLRVAEARGDGGAIPIGIRVTDQVDRIAV
jgi:hypothetical protein